MTHDRAEFKAPGSLGPIRWATQGAASSLGSVYKSTLATLFYFPSSPTISGGIDVPDEKPESEFLRPQDFFDSPKESSIYAEAKVIISETERREIVVETQLRNQEDWSYLANKVVGAEGE
jgi:hypothetical protein